MASIGDGTLPALSSRPSTCSPTGLAWCSWTEQMAHQLGPKEAAGNQSKSLGNQNRKFRAVYHLMLNYVCSKTKIIQKDVQSSFTTGNDIGVNQIACPVWPWVFLLSDLWWRWMSRRWWPLRCPAPQDPLRGYEVLPDPDPALSRLHIITCSSRAQKSIVEVLVGRYVARVTCQQGGIKHLPSAQTII